MRSKSSKSHAGSVPPDYVRKQTLTTGERYVTPELKELELAISTAQTRQQRLERQLFDALVDRVAARVEGLLRPPTPSRRSTCSPRWRNARRSAGTSGRGSSRRASSTIEEGRHPVMDAMLPREFRPQRSDAARRRATGSFCSPARTWAANRRILRQAGAAHDHGANRIVRSGKIDDAGDRRSNLHAHRRRRRSRVRDSRRFTWKWPKRPPSCAAVRIARCCSSTKWAAEPERSTAFPSRKRSASFSSDSNGTRRWCCSRRTFTNFARFADHWKLVANYHITAVENTARGGAPVFSHRVQPGSSSRSFGIEVARMAGLPAPSSNARRRLPTRFPDKRTWKIKSRCARTCRNIHRPSDSSHSCSHSARCLPITPSANWMQ